MWLFVHMSFCLLQWLEPNINKFDRISRYYQFIIKKSSTGNVIVRARPWPTSSKNEWVSLSTEEFSFETPVFKSPPPASFIAVPPSQRREVPEKKILDKYKKSLTDIAQTRSLSPANLNDLHHCLQLMASSDHLLFNWPHLSLSELSSDGTLLLIIVIHCYMFYIRVVLCPFLNYY